MKQTTKGALVFSALVLGGLGWAAVANQFEVGAKSNELEEAAGPTMADHVLLDSPIDGQAFDSGATVHLQGQLIALEDGAQIQDSHFEVGPHIIAGTPGVGGQFEATWSNATVGTHTVTASVNYISGGQLVELTSDSIQITVTQDPNIPPEVAITSPAQGATFAAPATLTVESAASDPDGTVVHVRYVSSHPHIIADQVRASPPYQAQWQDVPSGNYVIYAEATDNAQATTLSDPLSVTVSPPADVVVIAPGAGVVTNHPENVELGASATHPSGIAQVEFRTAQGSVIGSASAEPYTYTWTSPGVGVHQVVAVATTGNGIETASVEHDVVVNALPLSLLTAPAEGTQHHLGQPIVLGADATDPDGYVSAVRFLVNGAVVDEAVSAPFLGQWLPATTGSYELRAEAIDNRAQSTLSAPVTITVLDAPPFSFPVDPDTASDLVGATTGEFRVDEGGAATYNIPIVMAPGTAGVQPSIALGYSSQGGSGPFGHGWSVSGMSSIGRCRATPEAGDAGEHPAISFGDTDKLCLDGQRLLARPSSTCPTGPGGAQVTEFRTEIESFQRVCQYTYSGQPRFFTVNGRDGSTSWYGDRSASQGGLLGARLDAVLQQDPSDPASPIFTWSRTRFQDSVGNFIDYVYLRDPAGLSYPNEQVLEEVLYTGKVNTQSGAVSHAPYAQVRFEYATLPVQRRHKGFMSGTEVSQTQRLTRIESRNAGQLLRAYLPTYRESYSGSGALLMTSLRECSDTAGSNCLAPTEFEWAELGNSFSSLHTVPGNDFNNLLSFRLGDVDGDGRLDMVWFRDQAADGCSGRPLYVSYGELDGSGNHRFGTPAYTGICSQRSVEFTDLGWQLLDYTGDGRDDLFITTANVGHWQLYASQSGEPGTTQAFNLSANLLQSLDTAVLVSNEENLQPQFADINGDGVLDIIHLHDDEFVVRLWSGPSGWGARRTLEIDYSNINSACLLPGVDCVYSTQPTLSSQAGYLQLTDFDGDSRSDLLFDTRLVVTEPFDDDDVSCPVFPEGQPDSSTVLMKSTRRPAVADIPVHAGRLSLSDTGANPRCARRLTHLFTGAFSVESITVSSIVLSAFSEWVVGGKEERFNHQGTPTLYDEYSEIKNFRFADVNGDGLTDVLIQSDFAGTQDSWRVELNTGTEFVNVLAGGPGVVPNYEQMQLIDLDGDGRVDLVYPSASDGAGRPFRVRYGNGDGSFGADQALPGGGALACPGSCEPSLHRYLFADLSGDGRADFIRISPDGGQQAVSQAPPAARFTPRDVILEIKNGMGAATWVDYLTLDNASVYRRGVGSRDASHEYGRGSPVQDLSGAMWVVARAASSSPGMVSSTQGPSTLDLGHMARLYYRYEGARVQAGGRGFLGFERVHTIDANHIDRHVVTTTHYAQKFPFVGMPIRTERVVASNRFETPECLDEVTEDCFLGAADQQAFDMGGVRLSDNIHVWESFPNFNPSLQQPYQVRSAGTSETTFEVSEGTLWPSFSGVVNGSLLTRVETAFTHDSWGNVEQTIVETLGHDEEVVSTVATTNSYADDPSRWFLGRLVLSEVVHEREGNEIIRRSRFGYDMGPAGSGQLVKEEIQPDGPVDQWLKTLYDLDAFGNRVATYTCSGTISDAACRGPLNSFNRSDNLVHRQAFQSFDQIGRYPVSRSELFRDGSGVVETTTEVVELRDRFGHPILARDHNNVASLAMYGEFGRPYFGWRQTVPGTDPGEVPGGVETLSAHRWCIGHAPSGQPGVSCPVGSVVRSESVASGAPTEWVYRDLLGRDVLKISETFNAGVVDQDLAGVCSLHDERGRVSHVSEPFFLPGLAHPSQGPSIPAGTCSPGGGYWSSTDHDYLDRPVVVRGPDQSETTVQYSGLSIVTTDARLNAHTEVRNPLGDLLTVVDAYGFEMHYAYDPTGNLISVTRDAGNGDIVTEMTYDALGRKVHMLDPDAGERTYTYNALGEQLADVDNTGAMVEHAYDARGRVWRTRSVLADSTIEVEHSFTFDTAANGLGQLAEAASIGRYAAYSGTGRDVDFHRVLTYDALGRPASTVTTIDGGTSYATTAEYDVLGRAWKSRDASGEWSKVEYDTRGFAVRTCASFDFDSFTACAPGIDTVWLELLATNARGQPVHERRGGLAAMDVTRLYDPATGRVTELCAGANCNLMHDEYDWDAVGNLEQRTRSNGTAHLYTEVFEHDDLNRLTQARYTSVLGISMNVISAHQAYDQLGNICSKRIGGEDRAYFYGGRAGCGTNGVPGGSMGAYPFPPVGPGPGDQSRGVALGEASPHAVRHAAGSVGSSYEYDNRGNQTVRSDAWSGAVTREIFYSRQDQAYDIQGGRGGPRVSFWYGPDGSRYKREANGKRTLYLGNVEIITEGGVTRSKRYLAGVLVQERVHNALSSERYLFHDHLGSVVRVTNTSGALLEGMDFGAFGERRGYVDPRNTPTVPQSTERGFTGHEHVDGLDVIHMNGRIYDDQLGRFLQPDPVVQSPANPQNHNRYSYVLNNPLAYTDPSGHFFKKLWNSKWFRTALAIAVAVWTGGMALKAGLSWAGAAWAAGGGFASGVIAGGGVKSGVRGAFSATVFWGIGSYYQKVAIAQKGQLTSSQQAAKVALHGVSGGVMGHINGGDFGSSFVAAGLAEAIAPAMSGVSDNPYAQGFMVALVGGTASEMTGGKFSNGAAAAAFSFAFNCVAHGCTQMASVDADPHELAWDSAGRPTSTFAIATGSVEVLASGSLQIRRIEFDLYVLDTSFSYWSTAETIFDLPLGALFARRGPVGGPVGYGVVGSITLEAITPSFQITRSVRVDHAKYRVYRSIQTQHRQDGIWVPQYQRFGTSEGSFRTQRLSEVKRRPRIGY